ncbi:helix-turn-helix domain-containing protein [Amycolatopsis sp. cmx-4-68]|uniref:helix-turn-helix domain-containing protein n=1 Tax=Amycolatopsis sp. cmx-4-68 TaxID=2790938 RepID=UPI003978E45E
MSAQKALEHSIVGGRPAGGDIKIAAMPRTDIATPRARTLAASIRTVRTDAHFGLRELARRIGISPQLLSQWELGLRVPRLEDVTAILGALGVIGERKQQILTLAKGAAEPGWITYGTPGIPQQLAAVIECEKAAESIVEWSPMGIPGLLQTPAYARATFSAFGLPRDQADKHLAARIQRQRHLAEVSFEALIGEVALRDRIGTPATMFDQLHSLIEMAARHTVTLRVVPARCGWHPGLAGPFILYSLTDGTSVLHFEHLSSGAFVPDNYDVGVYRAGIKKIQAVAMSPADSAAFIARLAEEIEGVAESSLADE